MFPHWPILVILAAQFLVRASALVAFAALLIYLFGR
jgi:hypothetical protein